ncbi:hypothetical protein VTJ83DRAFT_1890 [Remersonia thermophila]|uniref:mRNA export factor GLE1 n=1 Tax=Remersonia thermophila TaxID=72144 RepID=A0ABR4DIP3_9PEZI
MASSSPSRQPTNHWVNGSPQRSVLDELYAEDRNSEARHRYLLEVAKQEHERVRKEAERVYLEQLKREELQRIEEERRKEQERIRLEEERIRHEEQLAAERARLNELKAKKIEIPPPLPEPEPPAAPAPSRTTPAAPAAKQNEPVQINGPATKPAPPIQSGGLFGSSGLKPAATAPSIGASLFPSQLTPAAQSQLPPPAPPASSVPASTAPKPNGIGPASESSRSAAAPEARTVPDRYIEIHKNLKLLRKSVMEQAKTNPALKSRLGDMRREIRKSVGQLTVASGVAGVNKVQQQKINSLLREALSNQVQSQLMEVSNFVLEPRNPVQGAVNNDAVLPSIFLYLINIFAKAAIAQFINEAGSRPETADPVGICVAATLSEPDFLWRGKSLIDMLLAKFRVVCPVLFGHRGSEKTEQGRARIGWWKDCGRWVSEQQHMDRMTGLGAGFAAISLRNFAHSKKTNPFPPREYWAAMARIVNTPAADISGTQCTVLKAMVEGYEQKFIEFYGTAALAALRTALIEFPARATQRSPAVDALQVVAQRLKRDTGLVLG